MGIANLLKSKELFNLGKTIQAHKYKSHILAIGMTVLCITGGVNPPQMWL